MVGEKNMMEKDTKKRNLVIIPAYNESQNILNTVSDITKNAPAFDYVVINDCSTDDTLKVLKDNHLNYLDLPINLGIGGAVQTGYKYGYENGYELVVQVDGDGQHDAKFLNKMEMEIKKNNLDMVIGSRFIEKEGFQSSFLRRVGINYFKNLIKFLTGEIITDPTSGLRMVNKRVLKHFADDYPSDFPEPETVVAVIKSGFKVKEIPVVMRERQGGISSINSLKKSLWYMIKVTIAIVCVSGYEGNK